VPGGSGKTVQWAWVAMNNQPFAPVCPSFGQNEPLFSIPVRSALDFFREKAQLAPVSHRVEGNVF
jgi:hypothetical protein